MRRRLQDLLRLAGLREEEVSMYLHLLSLRRASMSELIDASGLNVMTAYRTMKRLQERELVSALKINNKQYIYAPLTLSALAKKLGNEQRKLRKIQLALQDLDPLLSYVDMHVGNEMDLEPIEIREGVEAFREEYLALPDYCSSEYLHIGSMENYWSIAQMGDESPEENAFRSKRYKRGIFARVINTNSPVMQAISKRDSKELRTLRILDDIPMKRDYLGFSDSHICHFICDAENPRVIIIREKELANIYRDRFGQIWESGTTA